MFLKFPLFYISIKYLFSTKDKIVFFMQQFSLLVISLSIATIFAAFSIVNGFENEISKKILLNNAHIVITSKITNKEDYFDSIIQYNNGFTPIMFENEQVVEYKEIRNFYSFITLTDDDKKKDNFKANIIEDPQQKEKILINKSLYEKLNEVEYTELVITNPFSYKKNINTFTQFNSYSKENISLKEDNSNNFTIYLSTKEYNKYVKNNIKVVNKIHVNLKDINDAKIIRKAIEEFYLLNNVTIETKTWNEFQPDLIAALELQKKIFLLIYFVMFILLSAIIISTNIAFFKEKRKDWALLSILNVIPHSVVKIFSYKNIITFLLTNTIGLLLGAIISIYSNEILNLLLYTMNMSYNKDVMFGVEKITYLFKLNDILLICSFSFFIFLINFFVLMYVFKKEKLSILIKGE